MRVPSRGGWLSHFVVLHEGRQLHAAALTLPFASQDEALFNARHQAVQWAKAHEEEELGVAEARRMSNWSPL